MNWIGNCKMNIAGTSTGPSKLQLKPLAVLISIDIAAMMIYESDAFLNIWKAIDRMWRLLLIQLLALIIIDSDWWQNVTFMIDTFLNFEEFTNWVVLYRLHQQSCSISKNSPAEMYLFLDLFLFRDL